LQAGEGGARSLAKFYAGLNELSKTAEVQADSTAMMVLASLAEYGDSLA
jgi:hypothetical protein